MHKTALGLLLLSLTSCSSPTAEKEDTATIVPITPKVDTIVKPELPKLDFDYAAALANGNNEFALNLYKEILKDKAYTNENNMISPYSLASAFAMLYLGSTGKTEEEISKTFFWKGNSALFHQSFFALSKNIEGNTKDENFELNLNNKFWLSKNKELVLLEDYQKESQAYYNQQVGEIDFKDTPAAEKIINDWVSEKTKGKIPFIYQNNLPADLVGLLVNTIYFTGKWAYPFDVELSDKQKFTTIDNKKVEKDFMHKSFSNNEVNYIEGKDYKAIKLPYADNKTSLLVILPNKDFAAFAKKLSIETINNVLHGMAKPYDRLNISLPKWKTEANYSLLSAISKMGIPSLSNMDVSKMTNTQNLALGDIIHKTFIEVDEAKTEAAAATVMPMIVTSIGPSANPVYLEFKADKPFLYCIINEIEEEGAQNKISSILFMGQVAK